MEKAKNKNIIKHDPTQKSMSRSRKAALDGSLTRDRRKRPFQCFLTSYFCILVPYNEKDIFWGCLKPYTPTYLQYYNGKYKIQAQKATIDFVTCTVYRYRDELFYIADEYNHICMKHSRLDYQGNEQTVFEVVNLSFTPSWPVK